MEYLVILSCTINNRKIIINRAVIVVKAVQKTIYIYIIYKMYVIQYRNSAISIYTMLL